MSGNISRNVTAGYTEVDLSKKKIRKPRKRQDQTSSNEASMYDVLQRENPLPEALSVNQPKSSHGGSFKSSASPLVKVGLAVTVFLLFMAFAVLTVLIIILFLKISALEVTDSKSNEYNKILQKYFDSFDYINSTVDNFQQELTNDTVKTISSNAYQQNLSFLENILYREISSLNSTIQAVANNIKNNLPLIMSYNQTCPNIAKSSNGYSSGDYMLKLSAEAIRTVYCDVTSTLGGSTSGWMRIAKLDVNNCPLGFNTTIHYSVSTCIRSDTSAGCTDIRYSTHNVRYSNISGAVRALAIGRLDGFNNADGSTVRSNNVILNSNYLDGVSVSSNNEHVWSFGGGCFCDEDKHNDNPNKPIFVKNDFTCGNLRHLWKSKQKCGTDSSWFFKMLPTKTSDITVRVCRDQASSEEDIALTELELYVQ